MEFFQTSAEAQWSQTSIQRPNRKIREERAGRMKDRGMSHIWRALNVSSLFLSFPCSGSCGSPIGFPMFLSKVSYRQKCILSTSRRGMDWNKRQPLQSYETSRFIVSVQFHLQCYHSKVSSHQGCHMCEVLQACCKKFLVRLIKRLPNMFFKLLCTHTWPASVSVSYFI